MKLSQYISCDATALSHHVASGAVSPEELLHCALTQSARANPKTNAICLDMQMQAREQLGKPLAGPFAGVPFLLKDAAQDYAGVPTSYASRSMQRQTPQQHSAAVQRYLNAGLVIFGKTNLPEFALKAVTDSSLFGKASNPWALERTPGGSSGGAAAAVASGVVPMAAANDGGGSIRIPASYCGLFGLRPSRGRVSSGPAMGEVWGGASSEGVISRSVRDTALALDVLQGAQPGDPFEIVRPELSYTQALKCEVGRLRIGFTTESPIGTAVDAQAVAAVHDAVVLLKSLGHEVHEQAPAVDGAALAVSYLHIYFGYLSATVRMARATGATHQDFEPLTRLLAMLGDATPAGVFVEHSVAWNGYARTLADFHQKFDLLLTPTTATPAPLHGATDLPQAQQWALALLERTGLLRLLTRLGVLQGMVNQMAKDSLAFVPFTQLANLTGTPAMSVPLYWTPEGLPMGVQFVARFGREDRLLQLAHQLEQARPWLQRLPGWVGEGA